MAEAMKRGGGGFFFEGELAGPPKETKNKETGEVTTSIDVVYFGGTQYLKLADSSQGRRLQRGAWVRVEAPAKKFKENTYAGAATVTHIDGKPYTA